MKVLADGNRVATSVVFQATINRGHHLLQTLDSITHVPRQALAFTFVLEETNYCVIILKQGISVEMCSSVISIKLVF